MAVLTYKVTRGRIPSAHTIKAANLLRTSVMAQYGRRNHGNTSVAFAGKDTVGKPLSGHSHAFFIPLDIDSDGAIDHMTIIRRSGFNTREVAAMFSVNNLRSKKDNIDVYLSVQHYAPSSHKLNTTSRKWVSLTPFLLNRHVKHRAGKIIDAPDDQVRLEILRRLPTHTVVGISIYPDNRPMILSGLKPNQYTRSRKSGERDRPAYELKLEFDLDVEGPLLLGYGCHYGMGHFVPDTINCNDVVSEKHSASMAYLERLCCIHN